MRGFADAYLQKSAIRPPLVELEPHSHLNIIVTIPVYHESGLERCLDSLYQRALPGSSRAEVLILINAPISSPREILEHNQQTLYNTRTWIRRHHHPGIEFHVMLDHTFSKSQAGVGTARKILMDEAIRRFNKVGNTDGIIASLDADVVVEPNYLEALLEHFGVQSEPARAGADQTKTGKKRSPVEGCAVYFEHPLSVEEGIDSGLLKPEEAHEVLTPGIIDAISRYELHLRYYVHAVRSTGYPYAFHTLGSAFAVRAHVYCKEGGKNRREGGEDFYFIQKIAQRGHFSDCVSTRVIPSPRPSDRVPFGTGPVIRRLTSGGETMESYDPALFGMLKQFFSGLEKGFVSAGKGDWIGSQHKVLQEFLESQEFTGALKEILDNCGSYPAFQKRFWRWFNMFRILKFLHFARDHGYPEIPVEIAAAAFLSPDVSSDSDVKARPEDVKAGKTNLKQLLSLYRLMDRSSSGDHIK